MSISRRTLLVGAASGFSVLVLTACTDDAPAPTASPTGTLDPTVAPEAKSFSRSNWAGDPFALGATSYLAVGALPQSREVLREPIVNRVFLAGEAISDEPGTVRGAMASGRYAARRALGVMGDGERVVVVGAGAAGAAAARLLAASGAEVIVIEARDRTGGRIDSRVRDDDHYFELGAWRLAAVEDAELIGMLAAEGVDVAALAAASSYALDNDAAIAQLPADDPALLALPAALGDAAAWAQQRPHDVSVAEAVREGADLDASGEVSSEALEGQLLLAVSALTGADADMLSAWFATPAIESEPVVPTGPLSSVIDASLEGIDTVLSAAVVGIAYDDDAVSLRLATGESLRADRVVVTVPLGVLHEQVIEFDPVLPLSHRAALDALSVGHIELVRMEYETPFWTTDAVWWVQEAEQPIRLWINLLPATGRPVLLGVAVGESARELSDANDATVHRAAQQSLAPFVSPDS